MMNHCEAATNGNGMLSFHKPYAQYKAGCEKIGLQPERQERLTCLLLRRSRDELKGALEDLENDKVQRIHALILEEFDGSLPLVRRDVENGEADSI